MKLVKFVLVLVAVYLGLGLLFEAAIGHFQPEGGNAATLRTFDPDGTAHDRVLLLHEDNGQLWVESGHWFRGWYNRLLENPQVELVRGDDVSPFIAVPVDDARVVAMLTRKMGKGRDFRYWIARALSMFAPILPVRLDPPAGDVMDSAPDDAMSAADAAAVPEAAAAGTRNTAMDGVPDAAADGTPNAPTDGTPNVTTDGAPITPSDGVGG